MVAYRHVLWCINNKLQSHIFERFGNNYTTLKLNNWALNTTSSVADPWLTFTCNNGTWTPTHESTRGQDETTILNKAAELQMTTV